ncbi:MAG: ribosome maturation factor RimP [Candidatus Dormibacteraeota bacterium]|nr:ribosome maturation factor RimP [Candidatus Dormibacteraeota bacterium]MBO0760783.1 ribosome maturation factor RimP [Candidatus Dormibacteraeota bacterium]
MASWPMEEIRQLLEPTLQHLGYTIYALERSGSGGRTLRVTIDKRDGSIVSLDDCQRVSEIASPLLDQADLVSDSYVLEVSSPGAERELRDRDEYERFVGRKVNVRYRAGAAEVALEGVLAAVGDDGIAVLGQRDNENQVAWADVIKTRLVATL